MIFFIYIDFFTHTHTATHDGIDAISYNTNCYHASTVIHESNYQTIHKSYHGHYSTYTPHDITHVIIIINTPESCRYAPTIRRKY